MDDFQHKLLPKSAQDSLRIAAYGCASVTNESIKSHMIDRAVESVRRAFPDKFRGKNADSWIPPSLRK